LLHENLPTSDSCENAKKLEAVTLAVTSRGICGKGIYVFYQDSRLIQSFNRFIVTRLIIHVKTEMISFP
jgi:hypothetical protein